jgi:hypothetical protein
MCAFRPRLRVGSGIARSGHNGLLLALPHHHTPIFLLAIFRGSSSGGPLAGSQQECRACQDGRAFGVGVGIPSELVTCFTRINVLCRCGCLSLAMRVRGAIMTVHDESIYLPARQHRFTESRRVSLSTTSLSQHR